MLVAVAVQAAATGHAPATAPLPEPQIVPVPAPGAAVAPTAHPAMPKNTLVRLMVLSEVNSRDHKPGHRFKLRVDEDVVIDGVKLVPVGATAYGEVTSAEGTGGAGKSGRIGAKLLHLEVGGKRIALTGDRQNAGGGGTGQVVGGVLAFGILGLFMKGNNASIKAGEIINGYTAEDVIFEQGSKPAQ